MGRKRRSYEREGEGKDEIIRSTSTFCGEYTVNMIP